MNRTLCAGLLLILVSAAHAQGKPSNRADTREFKMDEIVRQADLDALHPNSTALERVAGLLRSQDRKGIWLVAPKQLAIDRDFGVSVLGFDYFDTAVRGRRYLDDSGVVVATRIESRETYAALIDEPKPSAGPAADADTTPLPSANILRGFKIELRERLDALPWKTGSYIVDVMLDQQVSNRVHFQVTAGVAAQRDAAVAAFIEQQRSAASAPKDMRPAVEPGADLPNYRKTASSLPVPLDIGITMAAERVAVYRPGARSVLRGSYRLAVPAAFYRSGSGSGDGVSSTAAVPITLVIVGNIMTGPFVAPLRVASYDRVDRNAAESVVTGQFEIDLFALRETSKVPQTYSIWAYSGEVRSAPVLAAVVTPEMLK